VLSSNVIGNKKTLEKGIAALPKVDILNPARPRVGAF
jgi:hypothetical protein